MKLKIATLLVLALILGCSESPQEKIKNQLDSGYAYLEKFDYQRAKEAFDKAGIEAQTIPYDRLGTALILEQQRFYFDALNMYVNLSEQYPDFAPAFDGLYRIYTQYGYFDKALAGASTAYKLSPNTSSYLIARFRALLNYGQTYQARQLAGESKETLDSISAKLLLARAYAATNEFDSAGIVLEKINLSALSTAAHWELLADALEATGLTDSAMTVSRKAAEHKSALTSNIIRHFERALCANYYFDARQAIKSLQNRGANEYITLMMQVLIAQDQRRYAEALVLKGEWAPHTPKNASTLYFDYTAAGPLYVDLTVSASALSAIDNYLRNQSFNPKVQDFIKTEIALFNSGTDDKIAAWKALGKLTGEFARTPRVTYMLATLLYKTGQFDTALDNLNRLRQSNVNHPRELLAIAGIYADSEINNHELAQETYEQVLSKDMWNKAAFANQARHLGRIGKYQEALALFSKYPHFEKQFHELAMVKALDLFKTAKYDEAFAIVREKGRMVKGNTGPFYEILAVLERANRYDDISKLANICADWADQNADILNFAARIICNGKEFEKGLSLAERAIALEPNSTEPKVQKARALLGLGKRQEAFEIFDRVLEADPNNGDANFYYSEILANEKIDAQRTTNMARAAVRNFYSDEKAFMNLCHAYLAFDQDKFAYGDAKSALREFPESPGLWYYAGLAANKLNRADAEENLKKAIALGLDREKLKSAKEILTKL